MGRDKTRHVEESGAAVLVASDSSCLMHIGGLMSREGSPVRVMHLAEVLAMDDGTGHAADGATHGTTDGATDGAADGVTA
jgi:L-lactate dehydrogenase complex protein LldE